MMASLGSKDFWNSDFLLAMSQFFMKLGFWKTVLMRKLVLTTHQTISFGI